jgi:molybdenum cofactor cytidylyltransferase
MSAPWQGDRDRPTLRGLAMVVLAAGKSARMGSPKALAEFEGRPLLEHLLSPGLLRELDDLVVVLGHHADALRPLVDRLGYRHVVNPDPDRGRTGSVQTGLRAIGRGVRGVFVQPVDCPIISPATLLGLAAALGDADVVIPSCRGRHGHPPLVAATLIPRILAAGPDQPFRDLLQGQVGRISNPSYEARCRFLEVDDPGVLVNIDRPEDLEQLTLLPPSQ